MPPIYVHRVNRLSDAFRMRVNRIQAPRLHAMEESVYWVDAFPITLANGQHAYRAKVASDVASKRYQATKKTYYYGVKAHIVARRREGDLPELAYLLMEGAARQDGDV